jgi:hypothetical protein
MLKKSLIAIALLALALPAVAGDLKVHDPWPTAYVKQTITILDVILDVGYYIHVKDQKPIEIWQDTGASDPYKTYKGCRSTDVVSNFQAKLSGSFNKIKGGGDWTAKFNGDTTHTLDAGVHPVEICVYVKNFKIEEMVESGDPLGLGGAKNLKVAELKVQVVPAN